MSLNHNELECVLTIVLGGSQSAAHYDHHELLNAWEEFTLMFRFSSIMYNMY